MNFSEADISGGFSIGAYDAGRIRIGATDYRRSLIVAPDKLIEHWRPRAADELTLEDFEPVLALRPEVVILGTGDTQRFPSPSVYASLINARVGLEIMDTGAACRTYNILMAEGRRVAAALIVV